MNDTKTLTIYRASAGSGKTFTLTVEYIALIVSPHSRPDEYAHTLAVTFTNKATAEMKDRILQHLYGISQSKASSAPYVSAILDKLQERGTPITPSQLREKASIALRGILHDYSNFRVETIDSFFQSILRSLARELGLSANLQVDLNDSQVASTAVDRLIDILQEDTQLQKNILDYVSEQLDQEGKWDITNSLKDFARQIFNPDYMQRSAEERQLLSDKALISQFRKQLRHTIQALEQYIQDTLPPLIQTSRDSGILSHFSYNCVEKALLKLLETGTIDSSKTFATFLQDPTSALKKTYQKDPAVIDKAHTLSQQIRHYLDRHTQLQRDATTAQLILKHIRPLQLLSRIDAEVHAINEENERFNLSQTPTLLSKLVDGQDSPFVFEKTGAIINNVMIDEFQDTSHLQWNNFRVLLLENLSIGGRVLIVGDIKQSIYRWRGGDWRLLHTLDHEMQPWHPTTHTLDTNYRSEQAIINFNNHFFPTAASLLDTLDQNAPYKISHIYTDVIQSHPSPDSTPKGYVSLKIINSDTKKYPHNTNTYTEQWMLDDMLHTVETLHAQGLPLEQIAILVRKNKDIPPILDHFRRYAPPAIHITSDEAYLLDSSPLVNLIIATLRMLVTDEQLNPIPMRHFLHLYHTHTQPLPPDTDTIMRAPATQLIPPALQRRRHQLTQMPLYELVEELHTLLHLDQISGQEAYHFALLDTLRAHLRDNPNDIHTFLTRWDDTYHSQPIPSGSSQGLRIITIHKAKGLEFHTVLLPYCQWPIEKDHPNELLWCHPESDSPQFSTLGTIPINRSSSMKDSHFSRRYTTEHLHNRIDELNSLYVAFTRASKNMYIWTQTKATPITTSSHIGDLINATLNPDAQFDPDGIYHYTSGHPITTHKATTHSDNPMHPDYQEQAVSMQTYAAHLNFRQSTESREMLQSITTRQRGTIYHHILSAIHTPHDIQSAIRRAQDSSLITPPQAQELTRHLQQIHTNLQIAQWFAPHTTTYNECGILDPTTPYTSQRTQRPDRIIISPHHITVIDYKFGIPQHQHHSQVRRYMRLLNKIHPDKQIQGYLWYVDKHQVEEVTPNTNTQHP